MTVNTTCEGTRRGKSLVAAGRVTVARVCAKLVGCAGTLVAGG